MVAGFSLSVTQCKGVESMNNFGKMTGAIIEK